jgi:transcriptional regulator GlxA family with amidase domain
LEIVEWAKRNKDLKLSVLDMAERSKISRSHFGRRFAAHIGMTPKKFLLEVKLEHAKELLLKTRESIKAISQKTGWIDPSHFCKEFLKQYGMYPTAFRKMNHL